MVFEIWRDDVEPGGLAAGFFGGRPLMERVEYARAANEVDTNRQQLSTVEDLSTVFRHVGQVVEPSVVKIEARIEHASAGEANPLRHFFRIRRVGRIRTRSSRTRSRTWNRSGPAAA